MQALKISNAEAMGGKPVMGIIGSAISDIFASNWHAAAIGGGEPEACLNWATAADYALSYASMSPMHLDCVADRYDREKKYSIYMCDQPSVIRLGDSDPLFVHPREVLVLRSDTSCRIETRRHYTTTSLVVPEDIFRQFVPNCDNIIGRKLGRSFGLHDMLSNSLDSFVAMSHANRFEEIGPQFSKTFLELLALLALEEQAALLPQRTSSLDMRRAQVKSYIDKNFRDADLTIGEIAKRLHLTPRYLQLAFQDDSVTPSEYMRVRRIEATAQELADTSRIRRSITEIAFENGFNSSSHFSTEFKRAYGMSPRDWRQSKVEQAMRETPHQRPA